MPRRFGWDLSAFDGREKKKRRTEWMNPYSLTRRLFFSLIVFFFFSLSLSYFFASNRTSERICQFFPSSFSTPSLPFFICVFHLLNDVNNIWNTRFFFFPSYTLHSHLLRKKKRDFYIYIVEIRWKMTLNIWFLICKDVY